MKHSHDEFRFRNMFLRFDVFKSVRFPIGNFLRCLNGFVESSECFVKFLIIAIPGFSECRLLDDFSFLKLLLIGVLSLALKLNFCFQNEFSMKFEILEAIDDFAFK